MTDNNTNQTFDPIPSEDNKSGAQPVAQVATQRIAISQEDIAKFEIGEEAIQKNPALVKLILETESMKDEERKYWFQLLPVMTEDQVTKLQGILQNEKDQLAALDAKYEKEVKDLNDKHYQEWLEHEAAEKRKKLQAAEKAAEDEEKSAEEDIISQLDNL